MAKKLMKKICLLGDGAVGKTSLIVWNQAQEYFDYRLKIISSRHLYINLIIRIGTKRRISISIHN